MVLVRTIEISSFGGKQGHLVKADAPQVAAPGEHLFYFGSLIITQVIMTSQAPPI